jgi:FixJ family two-component response regulator
VPSRRPNDGLNVTAIWLTGGSTPTVWSWRSIYDRESVRVSTQTNRLAGKMSKAQLISIVDDDASVRDAIGNLVDSLGYNSATFTSAKHFLDAGMIAETTCLIADLQMPGLSGLELQQAVRLHGYHTPVILIAAVPNDKQRARALENGAVGFLTKPFDERLLIECLTTAIKLRSFMGAAYKVAN